MVLASRRALGAVIVLIVLAGCGGDRSGGPRGAPEDVVRDTKMLTVREETAVVHVAFEGTTLDGEVAFDRGGVDLELRSDALDTPLRIVKQSSTEGSYVRRGAAWRPLTPEDHELFATRIPLDDPAAALDLLVGARDIGSYGGQEVRGVSTMRYEFVARGGARCDVWIDSVGRVRRLQFPTDPEHTTTSLSREGVAFGVTTVDFFEFGTAFDAPVPSG